MRLCAVPLSETDMPDKRIDGRNDRPGKTVRQTDKIQRYPKFRFRQQWLDYATALHDECGRFLRAVVRYGLYEELPKTLSVLALEYFNGVVRPDLDRQHDRMKKGGRA